MKNENITYREYFESIDKFRNVKRWCRRPALDRSNIMEHSFRVAMFVNELLKGFNDKLYKDYIENHASPEEHRNREFQYYMTRTVALSYALQHDAGEPLGLGVDMPHELKKRYPELKQICDRIEDESIEHIFEDEWDLNKNKNKDEISLKKIKEIVKLADILDYTYESLKEISLGNQEAEYHKAIARGLKDAEIRETVREDFLPIFKKIRDNLLTDYCYTQPDNLDFSY